MAQTPVVVLVVAARNPADVGRSPVPVDMAGGVHQPRVPEPSPGRVPVPTAVVVGERPPGIPRHPVQPGGSVGPPAPAVRLPVLLDVGLPGPSILHLDPLAVLAERVAVATGVDSGVGHESGPMVTRPVVQRGRGHAGAALELDPGVVEAVGDEGFAAAYDHRPPLRYDFREAGEDGYLGPAASVVVDLVAAVLLQVDPGIRCVDHGEVRLGKVVFQLQAEPPPVEEVERVRVLAVRRTGDPREGDLGVVVQRQDRAVRHEDGESRVRRRPDPIAAQDRQMEFQIALGAGTSREQGGVPIQGANEAVDAGEALRVFRSRRLAPGDGCGEDDRKGDGADRKRVSHLTVPLRNRSAGKLPPPCHCPVWSKLRARRRSRSGRRFGRSA